LRPALARERWQIEAKPAVCSFEQTVAASKGKQKEASAGNGNTSPVPSSSLARTHMGCGRRRLGHGRIVLWGSLGSNGVTTLALRLHPSRARALV